MINNSTSPDFSRRGETSISMERAEDPIRDQGIEFRQDR